MNHFFVQPDQIQADAVRLNLGQSHQICHVLRLKQKDHIVVLDNSGYEYDIELESLSAREVCGRVLGKRPVQTEPTLSLTLFQSMLARDKFEWVLQKCTEVGVARIVPVITQRSLVQKKDRIKSGKLQRWQRILTEAAEQSGRGRVPVLEPPEALATALDKASTLNVSLIAVPDGQADSLREVLQRTAKQAISSVGLYIGPEGGFDPKEVKRANAAGARTVHLGRRILRTETAAVVTSALVLYELGELM
jgi:16S rRNA (uracil1498-N3)-methyltransferase